MSWFTSRERSRIGRPKINATLYVFCNQLQSAADRRTGASHPKVLVCFLGCGEAGIEEESRLPIIACRPTNAGG